MDKEFVTYDQALALKELGFYEHCMGFYYYAVPELRWMLQISSDYHKIVSIIDAPLKQQVFRWFRDKYDADFYITRILPNVVNRDIYHIVLNDRWAPNESHKNYEDAESRLIDNLIELVKYQDND